MLLWKQQVILVDSGLVCEISKTCSQVF